MRLNSKPILQATSAVLICAGLIATSCSKKDDSNNNNPGCTGSNCGSTGPGSSAQVVTADLTGAVGLLVIDNSANSKLRIHNDSVRNLNLNAPIFDEKNPPLWLANSADADAAAQSSLNKVTSTGDVTNAMSVKKNETQKSTQSLPKILTIAVSPANEIFLHFERSFVYKEPPTGSEQDAWDQSKGYQCQIFRVKGGTLAQILATPPTENNLECIDDQHFINNWKTSRNSVFQFDKDGNIYYPGALPSGDNKTVVYKVLRTDLTKKTEMINANICVNDFLVTKAGGIFYTGQNSCNGGSSDGGFFRYVLPASAGVSEIARNWWNFVFEPKEGATTDTAVFFGPDPRTATTASWNNACLFNYDPLGADATTRISNVITCGSDIWNWINMTREEDITTYGKGYTSMGQRPEKTTWLPEFKSRCQSEGQVFAGGGSQISSIKQSSTGEVYVIGHVRKKKKGSFTCNLQIKGPHCVKANIPYLADATTKTLLTSATCTSSGGTWVNAGKCRVEGEMQGDFGSTIDTCMAYTPTNSGSAVVWESDVTNYNVESDLCDPSADKLSTTVDLTSQRVIESNNSSDNIWSQQVNQRKTKSGSTYTTDTSKFITKFQAGYANCIAPAAPAGGGDSWTEEFTSMAKVNATTKNLTLMSKTTEQAIKLWLIDDVPYYSSYNTTLGKYLLTNGKTGEVMASNFEIYNLSKSDTATKLFYDGLDFSNNQYSFGTIDISTSAYTKTAKQGITGTVKTIVILPK